MLKEPKRIIAEEPWSPDYSAVTLEISNDISEDMLSLLLKEVIHA